MRHPGYSGWLLFVMAGQLMLGNFICCMAFTVVGWRFFSLRIPYDIRIAFGFFVSTYHRTASGMRNPVSPSFSVSGLLHIGKPPGPAFPSSRNARTHVPSPTKR
jgi:hypothetical protein